VTSEPVVGEPVVIEIAGEPASLRIQSPSSVFRYLGTPGPETVFIPQEPGSYRVLLLDDQEGVLLDLAFLVAPRTSRPADNAGPVISIAERPSGGGDTILGPKGRPFAARVTLRDVSGNTLTVAPSTMIPEVEIVPDDPLFEKLVLRQVSPDGLKLGLDRPSAAKVRIPGASAIVSTFAIDPSQASFVDGELTKVAAGSALYKCADWDFTEGLCRGAWTKLQDLVPGTSYSIPITPEDPGFAETGVATINAVKPIVVPGETAVLLSAILDTRGFLVSGANVTVIVTGPDGTETMLSTDAGTVIEESRGIYALSFVHTSLEGIYLVQVAATAPGVDMVMNSSFTVAEHYPYDVLRESPMSIDPWQGPFHSTIRIERKDAVPGLLNVTERIPSSFSIVDDGGADVSLENGSFLLIWRNVGPGTSLNYAVQAPLVTPDLYTLGMLSVESVAGIQIEARPWFLAIDPSATLLPELHVNTEVGGTDLTAAQVTDISSDNTAYVTFTKGTTLTSELSNMTNISMVESVQSINCSVTYTSQAYSPAANYTVYDAFGANILGSTTLPASTGVDNTVTLFNLQNNPNFQISDLNTLVMFVRNDDGGTPQTISVDYLRCVVAYTEKDIAPPNITLNSPNEATYFDGSFVVFNFTPSDNRALKNCTLFLDGSYNQSNATPLTNNSAYTFNATLAEGQHNWSINCSDTSNNSVVSATRNLTIDLTNPSAFNLSAPPNDTVSTSLTPTFSWDPTTETNFRNYTLLLDDDPAFGSPNYIRGTFGTTANTSYAFTTVLASNTKYYWQVVVYDWAGRTVTSSQTWTYIADTAAPGTFTLLSPSSGSISSNRLPLLDWQDTVETNFANYTVLFDNNADFSSPEKTYFSYNLVTNSSYQVLVGELLDQDMFWYWRVVAYDRAGLSRNSTATFNYTTDNTGPNITLFHPPSGWSENTTNTLLFNFSVNDTFSAIPSCTLLINGTVYQTKTNVPKNTNQTFSQYLDNGLYSWRINCTDSAGNTNETAVRSLTVNVTSDITGPVITPNSPAPAAFLNASTVLFNYTVQDATGIENCSLFLDGVLNVTNGTVTNNAENYFTVNGIADGFHTWFVSCYDNSTLFNNGNGTVRNFTVDTSPPTPFALVAPANGTRTNQSILTFNWTQTTETNFRNYTVVLDNDSTFTSPEYLFSTNTITAVGIISSALLDNRYYWKVIAYDLAGNARVSSQTWELEIHTQAPIILSVDEDPLDPVQYSPGRIYNFSVTIDEPEVDSVLFEHDLFGTLENSSPTGNSSNTFSFAAADLNASVYVYRWRVNDTFGNVNITVLYSYNITKNTTTTTLLLDGVAANRTVNESAIVNLTGLLNWPSDGTLAITQNGTTLTTNLSPATILRNFTIPGIYGIAAVYAGSQNYFASSASWNLTVLDNAAPVVTLVSPSNASNDTDGDVSYAFFVNDTNALANCTLYIDGVANDTITTPTKEITLYFDRTYTTNRNLTWQVRCFDVAGFEGNSSVYNLSIQIRRFTLNLVPTVCSDSNGCTASNINVSDATWEAHGTLSRTPGNNYVNATVTTTAIPGGATIKNVTILWEKYQDTATGTFYLAWLNGSTWVTICSKVFVLSTTATPDNLACVFDESIFPNRTSFNNGLIVRADFFYTGTASGKVYGTNYVSVNVTYEEDTTAPSVVLNDPQNGQEIGAGAVIFNITATDPHLTNCTLYGDFNGTWLPNTTIAVDDNLVSGQKSSFASVSLQPGFYYWNARCYDEANNSAFASQNYTLNITPPDLTVSQNAIFFNVSFGREGQNITINATIFNDGYTAADNFTVQFFIGDPAAGGVQIGVNQTILYLAGLSNTSLTQTHLLRPGPNKIFILVDGNDAIMEIDETNNEANTTFHVGAYHTYFGSLIANVTLDTSRNDTFKSFFFMNATGTLFFARTGVSIQFASLEPLGRTSTGAATTDDFTQADDLLNMTEFNDSIAQLWTNGTNTPLQTETFEIYGDTLVHVPIVSSDNTSNFITGILWDSSHDLSSNTEYDVADKEPLIFISRITQDTVGEYGLSDFVQKVPALLRSYANQSTTTITIYYELQ